MTICFLINFLSLHPNLPSSTKGFDENEIKDITDNIINNDNKGKIETLHLYEQTQTIGINSIPTLIIDGQFSISGAANNNEIYNAIKHVLDSSTGPTGNTAFERQPIA
jgi:predicted DsbA family dithiol-disulfide isomerase